MDDGICTLIKAAFLGVLLLCSGCVDGVGDPRAFYGTHQTELGYIVERLKESDILRVGSFEYEQTAKLSTSSQDRILYNELMEFIRRTNIISIDSIKTISGGQGRVFKGVAFQVKRVIDNHGAVITYVTYTEPDTNPDEFYSNPICEDLAKLWHICQIR